MAILSLGNRGMIRTLASVCCVNKVSCHSSPTFPSTMFEKAVATKVCCQLFNYIGSRESRTLNVPEARMPSLSFGVHLSCPA
jgi:hypothetical protein